MAGITRRSFLKGTAATTGALALYSAFGGTWAKDLLEEGALPADNEEFIPTTCWIGKQDCGILVRKVNGRLVKFEGHPKHPRNLGTLCVKGMSQLQAVYDPYRVKAPLRRTNAKGQSGEWVEISWDEAIAEVGDRIRDIRHRNPKLLLWQKGRSKSGALYDEAFLDASGAVKLHHGAYCSDAGYRAMEYTVGFKGVLHPDFKHCNFLLSWGWNITGAGGNQLCWITWPREFLDARERGLKTVIIDPMRRQAGPFGEKWLPIRPGTDLAFFNALSHELLANGFLDRPYLTKHTNVVFLVDDRGHFLKEGEKELVWDLKAGRALAFDAAADPALEGTYAVDGKRARPAFELLKEHLAPYTPEFAAGVCGLSADDIREVALTLGREARIGSTLMIDGREVPYRPVGIMGYHVTQQELGFQAARAAITPFLLLGAFEAAGGVKSDMARSITSTFDSHAKITVKDPPYGISLGSSKFYPLNSNNSGVAMKALLDPEKYGISPIPEMMLIHMSNPLLSFPDQKVFMDAYKKLQYIAVIDPWMSETADYFADIVLPAATIEKYEGPLGVGTQYVDAKTLRMPPIEPMFKSRSEVDIYLDLCERAGILFGEHGYLEAVNHHLKLKEEFHLPTDRKPQVSEIFDAWARSEGFEGGLAFFRNPALHVKPKPIPVEKLYAPLWNPPYGGVRHRIYGEHLLGLQEQMRAKGAAEIYWRDHTALPTWRSLTLDASPAQYDLYLISFKKMQFKQSRSTFIPTLHELEPEQRLEMNPEAAAARGISDGDMVAVESQNAITGETRQVRTRVNVRDYIRPDTVAMSHHYGNWVSPVAKDVGPSPNQLFFTGEGYVANTVDQSYHVKVRVFKEVL